ncbi:MAG: apolipoprotein N-acyltransferase [Verrucomicrobiales bacterium]
MNPKLRRLWPWIAALLSGVLLAICYPPFTADGLIWIWQAPLLGALWFSDLGEKRWRRGALLGLVCGLVFFAINLSWITEISHVAGTFFAGLGALVALALYLSLYFALFGAFATTAGRWIIPKPDKDRRDLFELSFGVLKVAFLNGAAWCGLEWLRGILFTGFGWNTLGVALKNHLLLVQFADVIGITGYGFVMMFSGVIAFCTLVRLGLEIRDRKRLRPHVDFAFGVALIIVLFLYGISKVSHVPDEAVDVRARIMQMNIPIEDKWSEDIKMRQKVIFDYRDLTRTFVESSPHDLVLWPETALPGHFNFPWVQEYFNEHVLKGDDFYLLTGLEDSTLKGDEIYNTITLMKGSTESYQMHKKVHLVPIGEYLPFRDTFPIFVWIAGGVIENDFTPGTIFQPLIIEKDGHEIDIVPLICFEDSVPRHARKFLRQKPQIMVNVTNDGWFSDSAQPLQHFNNALFRCIEFRRPMIRAANTGVSGFIDERGSVYDRRSTDKFARVLRDEESGSTHIRGSIPANVEVNLNPPMTIYARYGDVFSAGMGVLALLATAFSFLVGRRAKPSITSPPPGNPPPE